MTEISLQHEDKIEWRFISKLGKQGSQMILSTSMLYTSIHSGLTHTGSLLRRVLSQFTLTTVSIRALVEFLWVGALSPKEAIPKPVITRGITKFEGGVIPISYMCGED